VSCSRVPDNTRAVADRTDGRLGFNESQKTMLLNTVRSINPTGSWLNLSTIRIVWSTVVAM
jgi:hypothetical protein